MTLSQRIARLETIVALLKALDRAYFSCEVDAIIAQLHQP